MPSVAFMTLLDVGLQGAEILIGRAMENFAEAIKA
jgi:hypothetical protein